jgi:hypothetical protein
VDERRKYFLIVGGDVLLKAIAQALLAYICHVCIEATRAKR